jgi:outer membrane protein assembly factor BamB
MRSPLAASLCVLFTAVAGGEDWWQFRGPTGDGISQAKDLPIAWGGFQAPAWQTTVPGQGWSSPIVIEGRIWLTSAEPLALSAKEQEKKLAASPSGGGLDFQVDASVSLLAVEIDAASGEILRQIELLTVDDPPAIHAANSYASPTPITDGERLYCHFGSLGTACLSLKSGEVLWKRRLTFDEITGPGSSPILAQGRLILPCDGADEQFVVALDRLTGEVAWRTPRPKIEATDDKLRRAFSTPLLIKHENREQVIIPGAQWVAAYDPASGNELWRVNLGQGQHATVPRPVYREGLVYICTGYLKPRLVAIRVDGTGDVTGSHVAWEFDKQVPEISSPIVVGGEIYFVSGKGVLTCLDAVSGQLVWQERIGGNYSASPLACGKRLYFTSEGGLTTVIEAGREFRELARNELFGQTRASLAVCGDSLLIRTNSVLYCIRPQAIP